MPDDMSGVDLFGARLAEPTPAFVPLRAPFPYFGGKARVGGLVWEAFGTVANYVEPFAGTLAMLLANPSPPNIETVNDADGFIANFWRAVRDDPESVAEWADYPVSEIDLHARHGWLINRRARLLWSLEDPDFYDAKIAGWWVWGIGQWIGSGWCAGVGPWHSDGVHIEKRDGAGGTNRQRPHLGNAGKGVHRQRPHLLNAGKGVHRLSGSADQRDFILEWMSQLSERLRRVRVCCGDWSRVLGHAPTDCLGTTAIFLDPPYGSARDTSLYATDSMTVAADVGRWAAAHGDNPKLRIALCGYEGEFDLPGWRVVAWKAGGYGSQGNGRGRENASRERIWFSPHCLHEQAENRGRDMTLDEALAWADANSDPGAVARMRSRAAVAVLAAEVRRLRADIAERKSGDERDNQMALPDDSHT